MKFFLHLLSSIALLLLLIPIKLQAAPTDTAPIFQLSFENTADAITRDGSKQAPLQLPKAPLRFVEGINGSALYLGHDSNADKKIASSIQYAAKNLFSSKSGTVSFWVKPDWDGLPSDQSKPDLNYRFFSAFAADKNGDKSKDQRRIWLWMWNWLRCDLTPADGKSSPNLQWKSRNSWMKGDWWHVAVSWDEQQGRQLYLNGMPVYRSGQVALDDISYFTLGGESPSQLSEAAFDEFKIFSHCLKRSEIEAQFRQFATIDFTLERRFLRAEQKEALSLHIASRSEPSGKTKLKLSFIADKDPQIITAWDGEIPANHKRTIELPLSKLPVGDYRLQCDVTTEQGKWQRSFAITVYQQQKAAEVSSKGLELGECLVDIDLTLKQNNFRENVPSQVKKLAGHGNYLEVGDKKWDRIAVEVPELKSTGSPLVIEIEWPDDKERAMSFYLFAQSKRKQHRDRLSGGVQVGGEFPNSGTMQKTRYLFYPEGKHYLFEVRTLIDGLPAAVSKLKIYTLAGRLPKLAIETPTDLPQRNIGHLDEDQSFEVLMPPTPDASSGLRFDYTLQIIEKLLDHNDYTGQNSLSYPIFRYSWSHLDRSPVNNVGSNMRVAGWIDLLLDMMEQRGQSFFPAINLYTIADDLNRSPTERQALIDQGHFIYNQLGKLIVYDAANSYGNNPAHPAVRKKFLSQIDDILQRFGHHPAFKGINLWMHTPVFFSDLKKGYGDYTIAAFEKDSGIKVPVDAKSPQRFAQRYQYLTGPGKNEWLAWREQINRQMIQAISTRLQATKKGARLYINLSRKWQQDRYSKETSSEGFDLKEHCYQHFALDLDNIGRIDSVSITPLIVPTESRHDKHWTHNAQNLNFELTTHASLFRPFRSGGQGVASLYYVYFESFMDSLYPEKYASYFQNSDPKAAGRNFLANFAIAMAAQNPETIFAGAQPLGAMGREEEMREFTRNFRALPAGSYQDVPQAQDPVTARFLTTAKGTYLYQVNLLPWSVITEIGFSKKIDNIQDLGNNSELALPHGKLKQVLQPYQLRAYFIKAQQVKATSLQVSLDPKNQTWFTEQQNSISKSVNYIKKSNGEFELAQQMSNSIDASMQAGHYADAYRRIHSRAIRVLPQLLKEAVKTKVEFTDHFDDTKQSTQNWQLPTDKNLISKDGLLLDGQKTQSFKLNRNLAGDMIVEATLTPHSNQPGGWGGIIFRGAKILLRSDGFWLLYRVNGDEHSKGMLHKVKVEAGKSYQLKIMRRGDMSIFYVNGEKLLVANEKKGLEGDDGSFTLANTKYPVLIKQVKLSRILKDDTDR
ncbi:MAG: LamG domain-containing protein [Verrucomicrobiales bacterium]|nr:LamG domain-containing protein [Verrucomicrobiales bacterium]